MHEDDARARPQRVVRRVLPERRHRLLRQSRQDHQGLGGGYWVRLKLNYLGTEVEMNLFDTGLKCTAFR